jgi:hypothetical protein
MTITWSPDAARGAYLHTIPKAAELLGRSGSHCCRLLVAGVLPSVDIAVPGARRSKTRIRGDALPRLHRNRDQAGRLTPAR